MPFKKGGARPATAGRRAGTPNKLTKSAREAFQIAFEALQRQKGKSLADWAKENPTEFYKLYARLIPIEHTGEAGGPIATIVKHVYETVTAEPRS